MREVQAVGLLLPHNAHLTGANGVPAKRPVVGECCGHVTIPSVVIGGLSLRAAILAGVAASDVSIVYRLTIVTGRPEGQVGTDLIMSTRHQIVNYGIYQQTNCRRYKTNIGTSTL